MRLKLRANGYDHQDMRMVSTSMRKLVEKNYQIPLSKRLGEGIKAVVLFPFDFILMFLIILTLPFYYIVHAVSTRKDNK